MSIRMWQLAVWVAIALCQAATPAWAEIKRIRGESGNICVNPECLPTTSVPALQGGATVYTLLGPWTDYIKSATFDRAGVSATFTHHTSFGDPSVRMTLTVAPNAAPGLVRITLRDDKQQNIGGIPINTDDDIRPIAIVVVRRGTISAVSAPRQAAAFTSIEITLEGQNIGNASADAQFTSGLVQSTTVTSNTDTQAVVRLTFSRAVNEVTGKIRLWDKACGACKLVTKYFYDGVDSGSLGFSTVSVEGPNEIKEIKVTTGGVAGFVIGQQSMVRITLRDASGGTEVASATTKTIGSVTTRGLTSPDVVYWKVNLGEHLTPVSGQATVPRGQYFVDIPVTSKLAYGAGCTCYFPPPGNQLQIQATLNTATVSSSSPTFKSANFLVKQ